jgi:predicted dehydrogenase
VIAAAEAGVRGICCEKPMATCLGDGRAMVEACRESGTALIVNHQRRMGADIVGMRRLILEGAIGDVYLIRGTCAGDMLGDGTHLVNSVRALAGDEEVKWVLGQVYREPPDPSEPRGMGHVPSGGWRYGYPIETGAMATFEFESGLRAELLTGDVRLPGRAYQDYEVFGSEGRLWRPGDAADPPVLILDERGGGWREAPLDGPDAQFSPMAAVYAAFRRTLTEGEPHPLGGESVLKGLEVVMAVHESARTRSRVSLPLKQPAFPLRLMIEADQL